MRACVRACVNRHCGADGSYADIPSLGNSKHETVRGQELCESGGGRPGLPVPNSPYGLCARKATVELERDEIRMQSAWQLTAAAHPQVQSSFKHMKGSK